MVLLDLGIGKLQIYPSVKWSKKVFTLRKPPTWALTKQASSKIQEAQWLHMLLSAHQGKFVYGRIYYLTKKGAKKQISAPAVVAGLMRRRNTLATEDSAKLIDVAADIIIGHKVKIENDMPVIDDKGEFVLAYTAADKAKVVAVLDKIPLCPVLTDEERFARKMKKSLSKSAYEAAVGQWDAVATKLGAEAGAPAYPTKGKKPAASGKSVFDEFF